MKRREFVRSFAARMGALALLRERCAGADSNIRWAVSMFLWTSTQWADKGPVPYTEMLDVIRDTGFHGYRFTGWPGSLERYGLTLPMLDRELSKRNITIATLSFGGQASDAAQHDKIAASAHEACRFLQHFGATSLAVFSPSRPNKVLVREHMRVACEFYNRLGEICAKYNVRAGLHNHSQGQLVESQDEVELMLKLTDPQKFGWAPDTVHLYVAGCNIVDLFERYGHRLVFMDFIDGKYEYARVDLKLPNGQVEKAGTHNATFMLTNRDLGDGEVDFPALTRVLKKNKYKGWICVDHHYTPVSPRHSFTRTMKYIRERLQPIYS